MRTAIVLLICILMLPACSSSGDEEPTSQPAPQAETPQVEAPQTESPQAEAPPLFRWGPETDGTLDLFVGNRRVLRYMFAYDDSTPEAKEATYKVYHHVFDETGENLITKGPGGLYSHHRGLFLGFNRLTVQGREYDFWHMKDVSQIHGRNLTLSADAAQAKQFIRILWPSKDGRLVFSERRVVTVHRTEDDALLLLDFESQLTAMAGDLVLDGDPEHAGFQFRAHNDVAEGPDDVKAEYLFHTDEIDPKRDADLPWVTMSFGLNGKRYSVQHMNHPDNPKPTMYSAYRDYGRFGAFPKAEIKGGTALTLRYRIRIVAGDTPSREACQKHFDAYLNEAQGK